MPSQPAQPPPPAGAGHGGCDPPRTQPAIASPLSHQRQNKETIMSVGTRIPAAKALTALLLFAAGLGSAMAQAIGTPAGTTINNSATLSYSVGSVPQTSICSSPGGNSTATCQNTTFLVDNKINLSVTTSDVAPGVSAIPGSTSTLTFVLTNQGNNPQDFALSTITTHAGSTDSVFTSTTVNDTFNPTSCTIFNGTSAVTSVSNLASGSSVTLKVACVIPGTVTNVDTSVVSLVALAQAVGGGTLTQSATNDPTVVDIVFADPAGSPDDSARDAKSSARSAFKVATANLSVAKTFTTLCDPAGGALTGAYTPKSIPGAYIQYTVTISNAAGAPASASLTNLSDTLASTVTLDSDLITGANGAGAVPACAPAGSGGTATNAVGSGFKVVWAGTATRTSFGGTTGTRFLTTAATFSSPTVNVPWTTVLPAEGTYAAGELKAGETVSVTFNVKIN
jgi:hypothetical protein